MINEHYAHKFCKDDITKIENYEQALNDTTQTWDCHHRLEFTLDGEFANTREDLIRLGMYYDRPYFELIFLTHSEHLRLHNKGKNNSFYGRQHSEETRLKMSKALRGKKHPHYGKRHTAETIKKMSEVKKGDKNGMYGRQHSEETRNKMKAAWARRRQEKLNVKEQSSKYRDR